MRPHVLLLLLFVSLCSCAAPNGLDDGAVHVKGYVAIDEGWLEQIVCLQGTRDHEALIVTEVAPSAVHAMLLYMGHHSGRPGLWRRADGVLQRIPPQGDAIEVLVQVGDAQPVPIRHWVCSVDGEPMPDTPWLFAGSNFVKRKSGEVYEADTSGSLVGLVTFGDETIAWSQVLPDQISEQEPLWQVASDVVPAPGTPVTVIFRRPAGH